MLVEDSTTLVASSHKLGCTSDPFGIHINLTSLLPEAFGTVFQTRVVITHSLPPAYSDLFLQRADCLELFVFADCVELMRSASRAVASRNTTTGGRWKVVWSSLIVCSGEEAEVPTS